MYYKILIIKHYKNRTIYKGRYAVLCDKNPLQTLSKIENILEAKGFQRETVYFDIWFYKKDAQVYIDYDVDGIVDTPYKPITIEDLDNIL